MKIFHYLLIATLILLNYSCEKVTEGVSKITTYVTFDLAGGSVVTFAQGTYAAPSYKAFEGTTDVTSSVTVTGTVNGNEIGLYTLTYSAVNSDGFPSSSDQTIIIYDPAAPTTDFTGNYSSEVVRNNGESYSGLKVTVTKMAPGFFYVSDFLGGFYDQGRGYGIDYGPGYTMEGYMQLNADNTLTLVSSHSPTFGDSLDDLIDGVYDPVTGNLSWDAQYLGVYDFVVTLTKQ